MQMNLPFAHKNVTKYPVSRAVYHDIYSNNKKFNGTCEKKRNKSIEFLIYFLFVPFLLFSDKKRDIYDILLGNLLFWRRFK